MAANEWYVDWFDSPFYHKLYFERDEKEAEAFIHKLARHIGVKPGNRVLDVACGQGRHSRMLASMGFAVTGIDLSPSSIEYAKAIQEKAADKDNPQFYIHDMRLPFWGNYFDYIFNFFTSFGYFRTKREHDAAIRTISRGLKPGGIFAIDYLNLHYTEQHLQPTETRLLDSTTYVIKRWQDEDHFYKNIRIIDPSISGELEFTEKVAKFSFGDFTDMLSFHDMQVQEVFGTYDLDSYDINISPRILIIAKKKDNQPADKEKRLYSDGRSTDSLT